MDWVRFENASLTQIGSRPISNEEKFKYLLGSRRYLNSSLIIEIKKALHKTLGSSHLSYEDFESVTVYIVRNLNNHPLT